MKEKKDIKILIDMDDTIEYLLDSWIDTLNRRYGTNVSPEDITEWDVSKFFPTLTSDQIFEPLITGDFWSTVKPREDAIHYVKQLKDDGYQVYICTNSNYKSLKEKMEHLLFRHFNYLSWRDVIIITHKQLIDADILVDDGVHNLIGGKYKGILMDTPHNRQFDERAHGIMRAKNWSEVYSLIKEITEEV